jgi:hypothetical protein
MYCSSGSVCQHPCSALAGVQLEPAPFPLLRFGASFQRAPKPLMSTRQPALPISRRSAPRPPAYCHLARPCIIIGQWQQEWLCNLHTAADVKTEQNLGARAKRTSGQAVMAGGHNTLRARLRKIVSARVLIGGKLDAFSAVQTVTFSRIKKRTRAM